MEKIKEIAQRFALPGEVIDIKPLKIGFINDSFIITVADGDSTKKYFLQMVNTSIFKDVDLLQNNIYMVTEHIYKKLKDQGVDEIDRRVMRIVPVKADGKLYTLDDKGNAWRVYTFITDSHSLDEVTPTTAYLAGKAFGNFQNMLADIPVEKLAETIPNFHNIEYRLWEFNEAVKNDKANRVNLPESQAIIAEIEKRAEDMCLPERLHREGKLPKRINHCDTKVNNMLVDADDNPIAIVDLDTVMPSFVLSDFGDFMRTAANTAAEDEADLDKIGVNFPVFEAFTKGYLEEADFLTPLELELLPFGAKLLTYMQTVRFFTDYLNGDTYYKILHPEHNLQRTRAQMRLLNEQEKHFSEMQDIVKKHSKK